MTDIITANFLRLLVVVEILRKCQLKRSKTDKKNYITSMWKIRTRISQLPYKHLPNSDIKTIQINNLSSFIEV